MPDADTLLRDGDLAGARAALVEVVRSQPANQQARMFMFQLLAVAGEWDKARNQLQALAKLSPEAQMLAVTYDQAMDGEKQRAEVFAGARDMPLLGGGGGWADDLARAATLTARGEIAAAQEARDAAFDAAPDTPGSFNGQAFEWVADADVRFGPAVEIILGGRYGLLPFDQIAWIKSEGPRDLRDIVWYPVQVGLRAGQSAAAFLPARYPGSEASADTNEQLGRATGWAARAWGEAGSGQHLLSLSDGEDRGLLELRHIDFS